MFKIIRYIKGQTSMALIALLMEKHIFFRMGVSSILNHRSRFKTNAQSVGHMSLIMQEDEIGPTFFYITLSSIGGLL